MTMSTGLDVQCQCWLISDASVFILLRVDWKSTFSSRCIYIA